jgi:hypothetical protein
VKKVIVFVMLAVFLLSVLSVSVLAPITKTYTPSLSVTFGRVVSQKTLSSFLEAVAKFEGTLQAYSVSGDPNVEEQVFLASEDISSSLESLNAELTAVYSSLGEEEQSALIEVYSSLGVYLGELAEEATKTFQDDEGTQMANFEFQEDIDGKSVNKFGGYWIGFSIGEPPK